MDDALHEAAIERREVTVEAAGRIDAVLAHALADVSRARLQRLIAAGSVTLNGEPVRKSVSVSTGDQIAVTFPVTPHNAPAATPDLPILYEDDLLVVVDKPARLATHGAPGDQGPSVAGWFVTHYLAAAERFDAERPGIVHRLDKDTSGVIVLAKTPEASTTVSAAFAARETEKWYLAICEGVPAKSRATIDAPIGRHPGDRTKMAIANGGREARTGYEVLGSSPATAAERRHSLLLVRLYTGRTHQIRVHLAAVGSPVAEDRVYGATSGPGMRQLLHAWSITVPHPSGGRLTVTAPLADDFAAQVRSMRLEELASKYGRATPAVLAPAPESLPEAATP